MSVPSQTILVPKKMFRFMGLRAIAAAIALFCATLLGAPSGICDTGTVVTVIDGDTLRIKIEGENQIVRLLGIDTPESAWNDRAANQAHWHGVSPADVVKLGEHVKRAVVTLVPKGERVRLEYDPVLRDRYGRLLAWVFLSDGTLLNERILKLGYGFYLRKPRVYKYADRLAKADAEGRNAWRGLWSMQGGTIPDDVPRKRRN